MFVDLLRTHVRHYSTKWHTDYFATHTITQTPLHTKPFFFFWYSKARHQAQITNNEANSRVEAITRGENPTVLFFGSSLMVKCCPALIITVDISPFCVYKFALVSLRLNPIRSQCLFFFKHLKRTSSLTGKLWPFVALRGLLPSQTSWKKSYSQ